MTLTSRTFGLTDGARRRGQFSITACAIATLLAATLGLTACANRPPPLSQVGADAAEKPINTAEQAAELVLRHSK